MRFDERFLDEIKARVRLSDVIGRTVKLRRQGREYVGLSPFSKEKTPSFYVNDEKGFFHDFSSGKHGDLIAFLQEVERLSFPEAVEKLAAEAGLAMPAVDPRAAQVEAKRAGLSEWLELAAKWFEAQLRRPAGEGARAYLARRGLPEADWERFHLGYGPAARTGLKDYLVAKGAKPAELVEAGLLIAPEDGGAPYDRFRDRIIFPIADGRGRVISFGGRALDPEARAKYLNGPETSLFHKGQTLYGLAEARRLLHVAGDGAPLVVVEGYMDVIACQRAEVAAVAPLGTALTETQMELLWRLHPTPTLCFDADNAGRRAAHRSIERALPLLKPGRSFSFALLSGGKDPDDVLREQGKAGLKAQLLQTRPLVEVLFEAETPGAETLNTPEARTALKVRLRKLAAAIADPDLSLAYRDDLLARYDRLFRTETPARAAWTRPARPPRGRGWRDLEPWQVPASALPITRELESQKTLAGEPIFAALVQAVIDRPELVDERVESFGLQGLFEEPLQRVAKAVLDLRFQVDILDSEGLKRHLAQRGWQTLLQEISTQAAIAGVSAPFLNPDLDGESVRALWSRTFDILVEIASLERALDQAKQDLERHADMAEMIKLKAQRDALWRQVRTGDVADAALGREPGRDIPLH